MLTLSIRLVKPSDFEKDKQSSESKNADACMYTNVLEAPVATANSGLGSRTALSASSKRLANTNPPNSVKDELDQLDALLDDLMSEVNRPGNSASYASPSLSRSLIDRQPRSTVEAGYISDARIRGQRHPIKLYRLDQANTAPLTLRRIDLKSPTPLRDAKPNVMGLDRKPGGTYPYGSRPGYETDTGAFINSYWKSDNVGHFGTRRRYGLDGYDTDSTLLAQRARRLPMCPIPETVVISQPFSPSRILTSHEVSSGEDEPIVSVPVIQHTTNIPVNFESHGTPTRQEIKHPSDTSDQHVPKPPPAATSHDFGMKRFQPPPKMASSMEDIKPSPPQKQMEKASTFASPLEPVAMSSCHSNASQSSKQGELVNYFPPFVKDNLKFWYKPKISREDAIRVLRDKPAGSFIIRDSIGFPGAYGLALKVSKPPAHVQIKPGDDIANELVRHYLIEPTPNGVRLKGCTNEPTYTNLSALVYHHSLEAIALPCKLVLPEKDCELTASPTQHGSTSTGEKSLPANQSKLSSKALLERGAACHVVYLTTLDAMPELPPAQACRQCINYLFQHKDDLQITATIVHFRVSAKGITLTDVNKRLFFRRHYPVESVLCACVDGEKNRCWTKNYSDIDMLENAGCFGFISRKLVSPYNNECHIFAEYDPRQPAAAIVNFISKVMLAQ